MAARLLAEFAIIVAMRERTPFPASLLRRLPNLRLLVTTGMRNSSIDMQAAAANGIVVYGTQMLAYPTVELTWALILALARNIPREDRSMRQGGWQTSLGAGLRGKTLALLGLGRLGREVAAIGKAFQMAVVAWSPNLSVERAETQGVEHVDRDALFRRADFLSIHLVLGSRSRGTVGRAELAAMKPTAFLINTSRGPIVDEAAPIEALRNRTIAGAGLDVFDHEPIPAGHRLRTLDNVVLTPHLGYVTAENLTQAYSQAFEDVEAFLRGQSLRVLSPG